WLGGPRTTALQPLGAPQRLARQTPDLLQGAGQRLDSTFLAGWTSDDATIVPIGDALRFNATQPCTGARVHTCMTVRYSGLTIPAGDLTVFFDVRADPLAGFPTDVPRDITVRALGQQPGAPTTQGLRTYAGGSDFTSSFYFRDAGPATIDLEIEIEGGGPVYLSNLTAHAATDALAREYHRGAAIANPSLSDLSFDLGQLFPGRTFRRLQASQLQDAVHNHGGPQTQQGSISSLDGLFLVDDREPVSDFTAAPYGANGGVTVQFTDQSTGVDRDQYWDFGDGSPVLRCEPSCSPEHTYTERGYYTVKLTSRNAHGRQAQRREGHIVIGDTETWRADDDFSSVQGHRGWSYFGWDGDYQALDFQGGFWRWEPQAASNWTRIYPTYDHPHHAESARAWRSPRHGAARITGRVRKANVGGDGVTASIFLGDERIGGPWSIAGGDTTGVPFDLEVPIRQGQSLYFRLHRNGDHFSDATRWQDLRIDLTSLELPAVDFTVIRPANQTPPRAIFQNDTLVPVETPTVRWAWDFDDDGDVDSWREQGFSFYPEPGSYDVRLRAENDAGWGEERKEDAVVVVPSQPQTWVAADGFSGQQGGADGQNPWLYLEWNGATGAYQPLTWQGDHWRGTTVWTRIYASYDHPDGYPVARAWQAPWPGTARIQGQVRLTNPAGCGDGVRAWLFHDDIVIGGPYDLAAGDSVGQSIDVSVPVQEGDIVYFRTHRLGDVACDATSWGQSITLTP
ncbi:MAG: PKD domain-containing protein, partial [Acidobacteriota bacterium]